MKAGIDDNGVVYIEAESSIEEYALEQWIVNNLLDTKDGDLLKEGQFAIMARGFKRLL